LNNEKAAEKTTTQIHTATLVSICHNVIYFAAYHLPALVTILSVLVLVIAFITFLNLLGFRNLEPNMALPSTESLQKLVAELNDVANAYTASSDLNGYMSRVHIIEKAKEITQSLITPDQMPNYHGLNVRDSIARYNSVVQIRPASFP
jgi:hypothetical protein